jgi:hypothetical protein
MARRPNGRRVKIHHNYTIRAAAEVLGVHKLTVSRWIAAGLQTTDAMRPLLIRGQDLRAFLRAREPIKQTCRPGEFFYLSLPGAQTSRTRHGAISAAHPFARASVRHLSDLRSDDLPRRQPRFY